MIDSTEALDEPDWATHPAYAESLTESEIVADALQRSPIGRPTGELMRIDPRRLDPAELIDLLSLLDQQKRCLDASLMQVLAVIEARDTTNKRYSQEEVSLALQIPVGAAQSKLKQARTLSSELPATLAALRDGNLSADHCRVLCEAVWTVPEEAATDVSAAIEAAVVPGGSCQTVPQFRRNVRRALIAADPATAQQRHERARVERTVRWQPAEDGMGWLSVLLPAAQGQLIHARLTAAAGLLPNHDSRSIDQQRADLFVDGMLSGLAVDHLPREHGHRPEINVVVSADTLLELNDEPAHLTGYGPITAETARQLAADQSGTWRRLLTDPDTGALLDISSHRYRPAARLLDFVAARDDTCAFPTCNQPGRRCEYDHITAYLQGGTTCRCNGALACRRHNQCKINTRWRYRLNSDGSFSWTTPSGHVYRSAPPAHLTRSSPPPAADSSLRPQPTVADVRAREDRDYQALVERWQRKLDDAYRAQDDEAITTAKAALRSAAADRGRQLANRADPNEPPF